MAFEQPGFKLGQFEASADLSSDQFKYVKLDGSNQLALAGAGDAGLGILQDKPDAQGQAGTVMAGGVSKAVTGASYSEGAKLTPDASGRLVTATATDEIVANALSDSGGADELQEVLLSREGKEA